MKKLLLFLIFTFALPIFSQEKEIWAKSIIDQKAPNLVVEKWLSDPPELKGKFVIIDFWGTWCESYQTLTPKLNSISKEFKEDLIVIGISDERERKVNKVITPKIEYYSAIDTRRKSYKALKIKALPHCILIDPTGIVRWEGNPIQNGFELTPNVIKIIIEKYKKSTPTNTAILNE